MAQTLHMMRRYVWWIRLESWIRWRIRRCTPYQVRKSSRHIVRWPVLSILLPNGLVEVISVDFLGLLLVTAQGSPYILLFIDRLSSLAAIYAATTVESTAIFL